MEGLSETEPRIQSALERWSNSIVRIARRHPVLLVTSILVLIPFLEIALLNYGEVEALRRENPKETAFMREAAELAHESKKSFKLRQSWVPMSNIPQALVDAVVVAEDGTFWSHSGFDWFELRESIKRNFDQGRAVRGASTITQQLVKNLYLSPSKNPLRKLKEWALTWYAERILKKSRIIELYLNVIEWGDGIYGAEAASRYYFGTSVSGLTREQCARLASIIPSPRQHRADSESPYVLRRTRIILDRMDARGMGIPASDESFLEQDAPPMNVDSVRNVFDTTATKRDGL